MDQEKIQVVLLKERLGVKMSKTDYTTINFILLTVLGLLLLTNQMQLMDLTGNSINSIGLVNAGSVMLQIY